MRLGHGFLDKLSADLAKLLGQAIWSFAKIEWLTYEYIEILGGDGLLSLVGDQGFDRRVRILRKLIDRAGGPEDRRRAAIEALHKATKLAAERNTIVHNPWQVYLDFEVGELVTRIHKWGKMDRRLSDQEVQSFISKAEATFQALEAALLGLMQAREGAG